MNDQQFPMSSISFFNPDSCPPEQAGPLLWPATQPGQIVQKPCFSNNSIALNATRSCMNNGSWAGPDFSECRTGKWIKYYGTNHYYKILAPTAVPQLRLVEPGGQYVLEQFRPFSLRCIADTYPVSNITWSHTTVFGPVTQSRKNGTSEQQEGGWSMRY